jgi:8-hydroxy-5-deazaflavin:NADPH oxidoreductase
MRIGILGSGDVGRALARGFAGRGHEVRIGTRDPSSDRLAGWLAENPVVRAVTFGDAAEFGEVVVLATLWSGTENALRLAGHRRLAGKVVIDATNPLVQRAGGLTGLALGHTDSGGEQVQRWIPDARVVKAFNIVGNREMVDPEFPCGPPDMFICGNDPQAREVVRGICGSFGWPVVDIGGLEGARLLEPLCILWVAYGAAGNGWRHAFRVLRRAE